MGDLGYAGDHILDERLDGAEARDVFATTLPNSKSDLRPLSLNELDVHVDMADVLLELAPSAFDGDDARLDGDGNAVRYDQLFCLQNITHPRDLWETWDQRQVEGDRGLHRVNWGFPNGRSDAPASKIMSSLFWGV